MTSPCESCSMPIESGPYCQYCTDDNGALRSFDETLERFKQWSRKHDAAVSDADAERNSLKFMRTMPAWRDHPRVRE